MTPFPAQTPGGGCTGSVSHRCHKLSLHPALPSSPADLCLPGRTRSRTCSDGPTSTSCTVSCRDRRRRGRVSPPRRPTQPCAWTCPPCEPSWRGPSSWTPCASTASVRPALHRCQCRPAGGSALPRFSPLAGPASESPRVFIAGFCGGSQPLSCLQPAALPGGRSPSTAGGLPLCSPRGTRASAVPAPTVVAVRARGSGTRAGGTGESLA